MLSEILQQYDLPQEPFRVQPIGSGLIHRTIKLQFHHLSFIVQEINRAVFSNPFAIASNIQMLAEYLHANSPEYLLITPLKTKTGTLVAEVNGNYYRIFPFVEGSHTINAVETPAQAHTAAAAFGEFTKLLKRFDALLLNITIPNFHNLAWRYHQFQQAVEQGNPQRIEQAKKLIDQLQVFSPLVEQYNQMVVNPAIRLRVTHHDTKISNVLFDKENHALCVIDLDTVMPGYFISDLGDMMRTYLSPANEEEIDFSKVKVDWNIYEAIIRGYESNMGDELSTDEVKLFFYAGQFMIYMQALRFLTDYLTYDRYYGAKYELHNYNRALNQLTLLERFHEKIGSRE